MPNTILATALSILPCAGWFGGRRGLRAHDHAQEPLLEVLFGSCIKNRLVGRGARLPAGCAHFTQSALGRPPGTPKQGKVQ